MSERNDEALVRLSEKKLTTVRRILSCLVGWYIITPPGKCVFPSEICSPLVKTQVIVTITVFVSSCALERFIYMHKSLKSESFCSRGRPYFPCAHCNGFRCIQSHSSATQFWFLRINIVLIQIDAS